MAAYTTIDKPSDYFNTILYTGNGANSHARTGVGFSPNWVWIKNRQASENHSKYDTVRGANKVIYSNLDNAENNESNGVLSFDSDGFTVGNNGSVNGNNQGQVAWNWKSGTSFTNDASSTGVGTIDSAGSVNTDAGFSIISYTGTGSKLTFAHGLGVAPKVILPKKRSDSGLWITYHASLGAGKYIVLEEQAGAVTTANSWDNTEPTSSVITINTNGNINTSGETFIAYCFAEKQGYSKFGSYVGNGNADGTFVYTGFKPSWLLTKKSSASGDSWNLHDSTRSPGNPANKRLTPNTSDAEADSPQYDLLSNGFKALQTTGSTNGSGATYIYMAFAENPFVTSTGVPATAR